MNPWEKYKNTDGPWNKFAQKTPQSPQDQSLVQPQNILGQIFNVPGAAIRSFLQGTGYTHGALQPDSVPTFQNSLLDKYYGGQNSSALKILGGNAVSAVGFGADMLTNPADLLSTISLIGNAAKARTTLDSLGKIVSSGAENTTKGIAKSISSIRDYGADKVNSIRQAFWNDYAPKEWKAYGDAIEKLPKEGTSKIDGAAFIQNLEKNLANRGLISSDGTVQKAFTSADSKLLKSYSNFSNQWANSPDGQLDIKSIVDEYKNIKGDFKGGKISSLKKDNIQAANDFFNSASDQINNDSFLAAKSNYAKFKQNQEMIHNKIDLYGSSLKTGKGERFLTGGAINKTAEARKTASMITEKTGVGLKGAKAYTTFQDLNPFNLLRPKR